LYIIEEHSEMSSRYSHIRLFVLLVKLVSTSAGSWKS